MTAGPVIVIYVRIPYLHSLRFAFRVPMKPSKSAGAAVPVPASSMTMSTDNSANKDLSNGATKKDPSKIVYEFGGPIGTAAVMIALPIVVLCLAHWSRIGHVDLSVFDSFRQPGSMWQVLASNPVLCPRCRGNEQFATVRWWSGSGSGSGSGTPSANDNNTIMVTTLPVIVWCMMALVAWFLFQVLLERCLPCELVFGAPIVQQHPFQQQIRLPYRINAHLAFWCTLLLVTVGWPVYTNNNNSNNNNNGQWQWQLQSFPYWTLLYEYFAELALAAILLCFVLNTFLYFDSFTTTTTITPVTTPSTTVRSPASTSSSSSTRSGKVLAEGGNTGNIVYDFFIGRELNPRAWSGTFDWKEFCELRPGLILWVLFNAAAANEQYRQYGAISNSMYLINIFHGVYVWDGLYQEKAILTTMDITTDGFGFMLVFGDLCWVPFTYCLQARYLVHNDPHLTSWQLLLIVALHMVGYIIFRSANGQKDTFRRDPTHPSVAHLTYLSTRRGTRLLTSGWWGRARKINYTGDWIMGVSWCMVCGVDSLVPYYYAIYFVILLVHRSIRDDHMCHDKYGDDWITYKTLVPYRFIPGVV